MDEGISTPGGAVRPSLWLPPLQNYVDGPAGFAYNPGSALTEHFEKAFFVTQFPAGIVRAFWLEPNGAGFRMQREEVVARDANFVGCNFGPDGGLYVVDWQGGYPMNDKGAVWRIDDPEARESPGRREVADWLRDGPSEVPVAALRRRLGHADQRIRLDAQWELVRRRDWSGLKAVAISDKAPDLAVVHAIWGLMQGDQADAAVLDELMADEVAEIRAQAAKWSRVFGEMPPEFLADPSSRVRYHAALSAAHLGTPSSLVPALLDAAAESDDPYLNHALALALSKVTDASMLDLTNDPRPRLRRIVVMALQRALDHHYRVRPAGVTGDERMAELFFRDREKLLARFLNDPDPAIVADAAVALHAFPATPAAMGSLAGVLEGNRCDLHEGTWRRAIAAARHLARPEDLMRLVDFARRKDLPESLRKHSLDVLTSAIEEVVLDSVDGRRVDLAAVKISPKTRASLGLALSGVTGGAELMKTVNVAIGKVGAELTADQLAGRAIDPDLDPGSRLQALSLLGECDRQRQGQVAESLFLAEDAALRSGTAARVARLFPERTLSYLREVGIQSEDVAEAQAAVRLLGRLPLPEAKSLLRTLVAELMDGRGRPELMLEVVEAAETAGLPIQPLRSRLERNSRHLLHGGDAAAGEAIFNGSLTANCTACHRIGPEGSEVGPPLAAVGFKRKTELLESLLEPRAQIAEGYPAPSSMPPMGLLLEPAEIRDLVEFLSTLRGPASAARDR
jgi:mono/diheme cytochrome c family protein